LTDGPSRTLGGRVLAAAAGAVVALILFAPAVGLAADPATVDLSASEAEEGAWQLKAHVVDAAGEPVAGTEVRLSVLVDFLGQRRIFIDSAPTDVTGRATLVYRPTWNGEHRLIAEAGGADGGAVVAGQLTVDVTGARSPVTPDTVALPLMRAWAVPVAALVVISVWATLGLVFLVAVVGIRRARPMSDTRG
jgi:hypothetical protein